MEVTSLFKTSEMKGTAGFKIQILMTHPHSKKKHSYYQGAPISFPVIGERMYGKTVR